MKFRAVIFDLFGTLVDTSFFKSYERSVAEMAGVLDAPYDDFSRLWGYDTYEKRMTGFFQNIEANIENICQQLGMNLDPTRIAEAARIRENLTRSCLTPRPDALETLTQLREHGYKTALITNSSPEVPSAWEDTPIASLVDVPVFSCVVGLKKPEPQIYRLAIEGLSVSPENCLYLGDGADEELEGALRVGMHPVLLRTPFEEMHNVEYERTEAAKWPGPTISALKEVLTYLRSDRQP